MLSEPNISYKPFWGICRPLNSWRANSPNPIQIYCAKINEPDIIQLIKMNPKITQIELANQLNLSRSTIKEYIKLDRDKSTFKSHRDFDSEIEMTFKHF